VRRIAAPAAAAAATLLLAFAPVAGAAGFGASSEPAWGPPGVGAMHTSRATRVHGSRGARVLARLHASATIAQTGTIEGTVTDAVTKASAEGVEVCAWPLGAGEEEEEADLEELLSPGCAQSGAKGAYTISTLPVGEYAVEFSTPFNSTVNYLTQFYKGAASFNEAKPVVVKAEAVSTADAAMVHGGRVSGQVTAAIGGASIKGIEICAWGVGASVESVGCAETNASGEYIVTGLAAGAYKVGFRSPPESGLDYVTQFYDGKSSRAGAAEIAVTKEATTEGINAAMQQGGEIKGVVTIAASGEPASEVFVCALDALEQPVECGVTEASGQYTIMALPEAHYRVVFAGGFELGVEYYKEAFSFQAASELLVTPGSVLAPIDAAMYPRALPPETTVFPTISGAITVGSIVSCSTGAWSGSTPMTFSYQWLRDRLPIGGATATAYTIQSADVGHFVACEVTASNRAGSSWARSVGYRVPPPITTTGVVPAQVPATPAKDEVLPSITLVPVASAAARVKISRRLALVRLLCKAGPCHGKLQLLATVQRSHRAEGHTVIRRLTVVLGSGSFSLAGNASANVTVHLTAAGRRLLAAAARHPRPEKLKLLLQGAAATVRSVTVD
jgi:hypothetical protein